MRSEQHLIAVQLNIAEGSELIWPGNSLGALWILAELLKTALSSKGIVNRVVHDGTGLNIGLLLATVDRLNESLTTIQEKIKDAQLLPFTTIAYVDHRESARLEDGGEVILHWRNHYPQGDAGLDLNELIGNPEIEARKEGMKKDRLAILLSQLDEMRRKERRGE